MAELRDEIIDLIQEFRLRSSPPAIARTSHTRGALPEHLKLVEPDEEDSESPQADSTTSELNDRLADNPHLPHIVEPPDKDELIRAMLSLPSTSTEDSQPKKHAPLTAPRLLSIGDIRTNNPQDHFSSPASPTMHSSHPDASLRPLPTSKKEEAAKPKRIVPQAAPRNRIQRKRNTENNAEQGAFLFFMMFFHF